ncbi:MAG: AEC family transporter [Clostridia bacterium]|nr:AEC family transporter [Clostridia bacterium]
MTVSIPLLVISVATLFGYMLIGFVLKKTGIARGDFASPLSVFIIYAAQIAMFLHGYIEPFDGGVFRGMIAVFAVSFVIHGGFYLLSTALFKKAPEMIKSALIFGTVFSNAGYMGLPLISDVLGDRYLVYATVYLIWFNFFAYTLGRYVFSHDRTYISLKKTVLNPAVIPIAIGIILYVTGAGGWIASAAAKDASGALIRNDVAGHLCSIFVTMIDTLRRAVAPVSMIIIGVRLAEIRPAGILKDKYLYFFVAVRHLLFPLLAFCVMKPLELCGLLDKTVMAVVLILSSAPAASATAIFSELFGKGKCDPAYAGKLVAVSTLLSIATMPAVALLLLI